MTDKIKQFAKSEGGYLYTAYGILQELDADALNQYPKVIVAGSKVAVIKFCDDGAPCIFLHAAILESGRRWDAVNGFSKKPKNDRLNKRHGQ